MSRLPIALQLYTVRRETAHDFAGTVRKVAAMGYEGVEFAGYGGLSAEEMTGLLGETGLRVAGSHLSWDSLQNELDGQIEYCIAIGCSHLVLAGGSDAYRKNVAGMAPFFEDWGRRCRDAGITFGYHNHDYELAQVNGPPALEILMERTSPDYVVFELDLYWTAYAGIDPYRFLCEHAGRPRLLHFKDMAADREFTEVGDGTLDLLQIYDEAGDLGVRWAIVENDEPTIPPLESAQRSLQNLKLHNRL